jgi:hypothetical protein
MLSTAVFHCSVIQGGLLFGARIFEPHAAKGFWRGRRRLPFVPAIRECDLCSIEFGLEILYFLFPELAFRLLEVGLRSVELDVQTVDHTLLFFARHIYLNSSLSNFANLAPANAIRF